MMCTVLRLRDLPVIRVYSPFASIKIVPVSEKAFLLSNLFETGNTNAVAKTNINDTSKSVLVYTLKNILKMPLFQKEFICLMSNLYT